jgi:hypothetical protein
MAIDQPVSTDLVSYLHSAPSGSKPWRSNREKMYKRNGATGTRYILVHCGGKAEDTREVLAVRRSTRVYLFTGLYGSADAKAQDQIRRTLESLIWQ